MTDKKNKIKKTAKELGEKAKNAADKTADAVKSVAKDNKGDWTTGAKVGAAIGSAAVAAALIYAGRHQVKKLDDFKAAKPKAGMKYENEPIFDEDDDDLTADYNGDYDYDDYGEEE